MSYEHRPAAGGFSVKEYSVLFKGVLERDGTVEYEMAGGAVLVVGGKVAETQELEAIRRGAVLERLFHLAAGEHFERIGVQAVDEVLAGASGSGSEKSIS